MNNMVDEKFECISVICRLAGQEMYNSLDTDYQWEIELTFKKFKEHEAVKFMKKHLSLSCWDIPLMFAVHIEKKNGEFIFIEDINSLYNFDRWTEKKAEEFLLLFNKFYKDTNYAGFYNSNSHITYFEEVTEKFIEKSYKHIDFEWFGKYVDISNLRCIVSPSDSENNYCAVVNDKIIYCLAREISHAIVHEYCHSFANSIARKWYDENPEFKRWCDESVDPERFLAYSSGLNMAYEYVANAYSFLYYCQSKDTQIVIEGENTFKWREIVPVTMTMYSRQGFPYISEIYLMVLALEYKDK